MPTIFISHSHSDHRLAGRLHAFLEQMSENKLEVQRSSDVSAIPTGSSWKAWIDDNIVQCDLAIVVMTEGSLKKKWVMWEAGALSGVEAYRDRIQHAGQESHRVQVLRFGVSGTELGPYSGEQSKSGTNAEHMAQFSREVLDRFHQDLGAKTYANALMDIRQSAADFAEGAQEDMLYSEAAHTEQQVQIWIDRLDTKLKERDYTWIASARRWINIAFFGPRKSEYDGPIDFRLHLRLAEGLAELNAHDAALSQLELAQALWPYDLLVLREIGRIARRVDRDKLKEVMSSMEKIDADVFSFDREAIALKTGYLWDLGKYSEAQTLLDGLSHDVLAHDVYLLNWHALITLKASGIDAAQLRFADLANRLQTAKSGYWDTATLTNAHMALGNREEAIEALKRLAEFDESPRTNQSAARYFDEILQASGMDLTWRDYLDVSQDD